MGWLVKKGYFLASHHVRMRLFNCILNSDVVMTAVIHQKWDFCPETSLILSHNYFTKPHVFICLTFGG